MQVMNTQEFEQTNVLLGQSGETKGFGVSNDPMLMSMLSTGLYENPLRTMLQEIMFNAWDAHRMGNCQDRPIDVYLNDTSGLIVRDYGPGISPDDMHDIYCIYGNSTKRDDKGQTGGFGLGSKSPFAYNDSFTVTSHHGGLTSMYVVNRASDENDGSPGMSPIMQNIPTEESGLIVTVPMKTENDLNRAYTYIKDVLYLSGIMCNLHYSNGDHGEEMELIHSLTLGHGEYVTNDKERNDRGIWAVYGGVRYRIKQDDMYDKEYEFLKRLTRELGTIYVGFAPDTLTPLPNREGLSMSDRSVESVKDSLETIYAQFQSICEPATKAAMRMTLDVLAASGIQTHFLANRWRQIGNRSTMSDLIHLDRLDMADTCPDDVGEFLWNSMVHFAFAKTSSVRDLVTKRKLDRMKGMIFIKKFPEFKKHLNYLCDGEFKSAAFDVNFTETKTTEHISEMNKALKAVCEATGQNIQYRLGGNANKFTVISGLRGGGKNSNRLLTQISLDAIKRQKALGLDLTPKRPVHDRWWDHHDGSEITRMLMHGFVIMSKTVTSLNETGFDLQEKFAPNQILIHEEEYLNHYARRRNFYHSHHFGNQSADELIPAVVVHKKKGGYEIAKKTFEALGIKVIEADEPEPRVKSVTLLPGESAPDGVPIKRGPPTFPILRMNGSDWVDYGEDEIEKPEAYLCCTVTQINGYSYNNHDRPSTTLLWHLADRFPRTAILHNKQRESVITKRGVPHVREKIDTLVKKLLKDEERIRKMYLHQLVRDQCGLPDIVLKQPNMYKALGIPYIRTSQAKSFERDMMFLKAIEGERYSDQIYQTTRDAITAAFAYEMDDRVLLVRRICEQTKVFDKSRLSDKAHEMKPGQVKGLAEKVIRFLRTV